MLFVLILAAGVCQLVGSVSLDSLIGKRCVGKCLRQSEAARREAAEAISNHFDQLSADSITYTYDKGGYPASDKSSAQQEVKDDLKLIINCLIVGGTGAIDEWGVQSRRQSVLDAHVWTRDNPPGMSSEALQYFTAIMEYTINQGAEESNSLAVAYPSDTPLNSATYALAALGLAVSLYGSFRFYCAKSAN